MYIVLCFKYIFKSIIFIYHIYNIRLTPLSKSCVLKLEQSKSKMVAFSAIILWVSGKCGEKKKPHFIGKFNIPQIWSGSQMFCLWFARKLKHSCFSVLRSEQGLREHDRCSRGSTNASELLPAAPTGPHSCLQPAWTQPHKCKWLHHTKHAQQPHIKRFSVQVTAVFLSTNTNGLEKMDPFEVT